MNLPINLNLLNYIKNICVISMIPILSFNGCKDNPTEPIPEPPPDVFMQNMRLGRGINFGNALEAPAEGDWGVTIKDEYFSILANAGFNSVRIPVKWSAHALNTQSYTIDPAFFTRIDDLINKAFQNNLCVIINIHHYDEIMSDPNSQRERFLALWKQISSHYKDYSFKLFFEILNEPNNSLTPQIWNEFLRDALSVIRETNPYRTVLIGTADWGGLGSLKELIIPVNENNVILTFHYYNPFHFTHQGAEWVEGSDKWLGTTWPQSLTDKTRLDNEISQAVIWAASRNIPLNCGEFGSYFKADLNSRVKWTSFVRETCEKYAISWHYWEFCAGFGIYDRNENKFIQQLLNALIPPAPDYILLAEQ